MTGTGSSFGKDEDKLETARIERLKAEQEERTRRTRTDRFCPDCPCLEEGEDMVECTLNPTWERLLFHESHYCHWGRQIMEKAANWEKVKEGLKGGTR